MTQNKLINAIDTVGYFLKYNISFLQALGRETKEFIDSGTKALDISVNALKKHDLSLSQFRDILLHSMKLVNKGTWGSIQKLNEYNLNLSKQSISALYNTIIGTGDTLHDFLKREAESMESVANFHKDIENIESEFGFHLHSRNYNLVHETDAFELWQVLPTLPYIHVNDYRKPVLLVPPYMLGANILAFLPGESKSYAHAFANEGIPTYVRITKDIQTTEAVQQLTPEEDCLQTMELCSVIKHRHYDQKVTLNGTCQGGYICLMNILSGHLDHVVDSLITNVTPIDGTWSEAIAGSPKLHADFVTTTLENGAQVADGYMLSLGMRFVAIDRETPLVKVLNAASLHSATSGNPGKTAAALFRWLLKERVHIPLAIANMSTLTFQQPVSDDGTLPVTLFGGKLNIRDLKKLGIKWYQCYAIRDDLVTPECATAANKFLDETVLESVPFPGGHVSILTSPLNPKSPVNGYFVGADGNQHRGPVKWLLEFVNKD